MARLIPTSDTPQLFILGTLQIYAVTTFEYFSTNKVATYEYPFVDGVDYEMHGVGEEEITASGRILSFENFGSDQITQVTELRATVHVQEPTDFAHPELGAFRVIVEKFKVDQRGGKEGYSFELQMKRITTIREKEVSQQLAEQKAAAASSVSAGKTHTVVTRQSLWSIALIHYGDGRLWTKLWDANKKTLRSGKPHLIFAGEQITIP